MSGPAVTHDPLGAFLAAYDEYLAGTRDYSDLPPAFSECPTKPPCGYVICSTCHPGLAAIYDHGRVWSALESVR